MDVFKGKEFTFAREWRRRKVSQGLVFKAWLRSGKSNRIGSNWVVGPLLIDLQ